MRTEGVKVGSQSSLDHTPPEGHSTWVFDADVASRFRDMLDRSVPLYLEAQTLMAKLSEEVLYPGDTVLDLGVSTAETFMMLRQLTQKPLYFVGVDPSEAMVEKARQNFPEAKYHIMGGRDYLHEATRIFKVVYLSLTLQFIPVEHRQSLLRRIKALLDREGGRLFLFEKCLGRDAYEEAFYTKLYYDFKMGNGYTWQSVVDKRKALENVLVPLSSEVNEEMLHREGFRVTPLLRWASFNLWMAE